MILPRAALLVAVAPVAHAVLLAVAVTCVRAVHGFLVENYYTKQISILVFLVGARAEITYYAIHIQTHGR